MPINDRDARVIFEALAALKVEVANLKEPGALCLMHSANLDGVGNRIDDLADQVAARNDELARRLAIVEQAAGKEKFATAVIGAIGASIVLIVKFLLTSGPTAGVK